MTPRFTLYLLLLLAIELRGIITFSRLTVPFALLVCTITATFMSESISRIMAVRLNNSSPVYHLFSIVEFTGYGLVYYHFFTRRLFKTISLCCLLAVPPLIVLNTVLLEPINSFPSHATVLTHGLLMFFSLLLFKEIRDYDYRINVVKTGIFWCNTAMLLYCSAVFIILGPYKLFIPQKLDKGLISTLLYVLSVIFYALLGLSIILSTNKHAPAHHERR